MLSLMLTARNQAAVLYQLCQLFQGEEAEIAHVSTGRKVGDLIQTQFELEFQVNKKTLLASLRAMTEVVDVHEVPSFGQLFGKRVIVMGGGAQVGAVAQGAISEADRHNIRGERISVDTIPLVGEERLAEAVRSMARLPRVHALVLAGALMGGEITRAVNEIREAGIIVICTNMAGSVPKAVDVVVSDPLEAGVMAVMLIADTAQFHIDQIRGKRF
ncbi:MAG: DUF5612 domain-containing protein [Candidatus Dormibacteraceae bacterium]